MQDTITTTVIGSYPVIINPLDHTNAYFNQAEVSWNPYIAQAVKDMVEAGIQIVSDGQSRDPFVTIFFRKLGGCRVRGKVEVIDEVRYIRPITVEDQRYVRSILPKDRKLVGLLAGPYTLSQSCVDRYYHDEKELAFAFASALRKEAEALLPHVDLISIDEPFFSQAMPEYTKELIGEITHDLPCPTRLHACGNVASIIPQLLDLPVDILSHEFKASPHLIDAFSEYSLEKSLCLGSVRSDDVAVESIENITTHIQKAKDIFGTKISQLAPDCGLRLLPRAVGYEKLSNLVKAGEVIYGT